MVGAFVICPCHLPLTLAIVATLLAGTALGAMLTEHMVAVGVFISFVWLAATWRAFRLLRPARQRGASR